MKPSRFSLAIALLFALSGCGKKNAEDYLQAAQQHQQQNDFRAAVVELKSVLQLEPQNKDARFQLGVAYLQLKQYENAEKEFNRALEFGYDSAKVVPLLARAYRQTGADVAQTELASDDAMMSKEEQLEVGYYKLVSLMRLNKVTDAKAEADKLDRLDKNSLFGQLAGVQKQVLANDMDAALTQLTALKEVYPAHAEVLKLQGELYLRAQNLEQAAQAYAAYVEVFPDDHQMRFVLAKLLADLGRPLLAEPHVDLLLKVNDKIPLLNQIKALARVEAKDFVAAKTYADKAIDNGGTELSLRLLAGFIAYQLEDYEAAQFHLALVASSLPVNHPALRILAASQIKLGMSVEADEVLARIDNLGEQDAALFSAASYQLLKDGYLNKAADLVSTSSELSRSAEDLARVGLLQLSMNNQEGILNLEKAIAQQPELPNIQQTLATAYLANQQFEQALSLAKNWQSADTLVQQVKGWVLEGHVYLKQRKLDQAKVAYEKALTLDAGDPSAALSLANLSLQQGDVQAALAQIETLLEKSPEYIPGLTLYFLIERQQNAAAKAIAKIEKAQKASPDNLSVRLLLAMGYLSEQRFQEVIDLLSKVKASDRLPNDYWQTKGQALIKLDKLEDAESHYDQWLKLSPNNKLAVLGKLMLLDHRQRFADALTLSENYLQERQDEQVKILAVYFALQSNQNPKAKKLYAGLSENALALPLVKGLHARILLLDKKTLEALPEAQAAYQALPNHRHLLVLVYALEQLGKNDASFELIQQHLQSNPNDPAAMLLLAERQIGRDRKAAIATYQQYLQVHTDNFVVLNNLAFLLYEQNQLKDAEKYARQAITLKADSADAIDTLGQILAASGRTKEALEQYRVALSNGQVSDEIYLNYVELLLKNGDKMLGQRKLAERTFTQAPSVQRANSLKQQFGL